MTPWRLAWLGLLCACAAQAAEPLVCRGLPASTAAEVIALRGRRAAIIAEAADRERRVWLAFATGDEAPAQALAHALGCWWNLGADGPLRFDRAARLVPGRQEVRAYPSPLARRPAAEAIALRLMDPWLGGAGGLVLDLPTGAWSATLDADGHAQATWLLTAFTAPRGQAPHLLPDPADPGPMLALPRPPAGADLFAWTVDLARLTGLSAALATTADPAAPAPAGSPATLGEALAALAAARFPTAVVRGCLCVGTAPPSDRRHPAQRRAVAVMPAGHLCRDDAELTELASLLAARVRPEAWNLPGWGIAPLPWNRSILAAGDPPALHAVLAALEAADAAGFAAWRR